MLKPLLLLALTANSFFIATVAARKVSKSTSSSSSSTYSSHTSSSSTSYTSVSTSDCDDDDRISCGGDPNARPGCDKECRNRCDNQETTKCSCPVKNSCECKEGYVFDTVIFKCVLPSNCTRNKLCPYPNEVYDPCPAICPPRRCDVDDRLIKCGHNPKLGDPDCKPGCRCADNYARNDKGVCVKREECPQNCKGPNEVYDKCPAPCPPQRCDVDISVILCAVPPKPGDSDCKPGCRCINDYVRNSSGICIPRDQCEPQCPANEVYNDCPALVCEPQKCSELGYGVNCTGVDENAPCPGGPGCICKYGYLRNENGVCIPQKECPSCKNDSNAEAGCGIYCNQRCSDIGKEPQGCILMCYPNSCDCKEGYYLDENTGKCVLPKHCTPKCGKHEVFSECINGGCDAKNCSQVGFPIPCVRPKKCIKGCICENGYLRNDKGVCVPRSECPSCGGDKNAQPGCGAKCKRCSNYNKGPVACSHICLPNGCDCKTGYVYDDIKEKCVLPTDCSPKCGENEVYEKCITKGCAEKNKCSGLGYDIICDKNDFKNCTQGCLCKDGYLRNSKGVCIPKDKCPSCGGDPNAKPGCGVNCGKHCADYFGHPLGCPKICKPDGCDCKKDFYYDDNYKKCVKPEKCSPYCNPRKHEVFSECINGGCLPKNCSQLGKPISCLKIPADQCIKGCLCEEGYLRAPNGTCIPKDQCNPCRRPHEYYDKCPPSCPPQTCESIGKKYHCPLTQVDPSGKNCKPACRCEKGYFRNKMGECISGEDCLKCTGPHEYFSCGSACDNVCETIKKQNQTNCPIINITCNKKCYCEKGYARAKNNTCIPISKCDEPQCPVNEEYVKCPVGLCRPLNCSQLGFPINCGKFDKCPVKPGCVCKSGYVRNDKGVCIPIEQCPSCGGDPNATSGCGFCGQLCVDIGKGPVACPAICRVNGCKCKKGYYYDNNIGKCVLPKECTPYCNPNKNEVFSKCINGGCQAKNCSQLGKPIPCIKINPDHCIKGCICIDGYLRASNGSCIPEDQCKPCTKPNEYYDKCPPSCPPQTCESIGKVYPCPLIKGCFPACRCKEGYFRNKIGECISKENCLKCTGPHEYYSCGSACDNVCKTIKKQNQTNCPIINITCNKKCYCEKDYARAKNGTCIPISKCDEPQCEINEEYVKCPVSVCRPLNCSQLGFPINCKQIDPCPVKPGCVCKQGYARNDKGVCVPREQCPSCGGDPNATTGCGFCGHRCSDIGKEPVVCPLSCILNGCRCRKGYYYDNNIKKCVLPKDCSPTCKQNERYEKCPVDLCRPQKCTEVGFPIPCPGISHHSKCPVKPGCICVENYARNDKGICIPIKECPSCRGDRNATSGCGYCGHRCSDIGKDPVACPKIYEINGCQCRKGYYYDKNIQQCVLPEDCSPQCGMNEQYAKCPSLLCRPENCTEVGFPVACPSVPVNYKCPERPRCVCIPDYVRNSKGVCVPASDCPSCRGDPNAVSGCGFCGHRCSDIGKGPVVCPAICEINGCSCKKGYYYDGNVGKCVLPKKCTPQCGKNEKYIQCPAGLCRPKSCTEVGFPIPCPAVGPDSKCPGKPGCVCYDDYVRNDKGICIPIKECPSCRGDRNATSGCGYCGHRCSDIGKDSVACPKICEINGCQCKKGYYYDKNKKQCVLPKDCSPQCGVNEEYSNCPSLLCRPKNCTEVGFPVPCPRVPANYKCPDKPRCVCIQDHVRNDKGVCVPASKCPSCHGDPNAVAGCGYCGNRCSDIGKGPVLCPAICEINGCSCRKGYYYDYNVGKCVLPKDCTPQCGRNEKYEKCPSEVCRPQNCTQVGFPINCPVKKPGSKCSDKPGCVCIEDYARNNKGICVPVKECPCGGDPNAMSGCGFCGQHCSDYGRDDIACLGICEVNGCQCRKGYYYDRNIKKCVLPKDCTPQCGLNEEYMQCPDGLCRPENCTQLGFPIYCSIVTPDTPCSVKPRCVCARGYARNNKGLCVPINTCPSCGGDSNATSGCGFCGHRCSDIGKDHVICPRIQCELNGCRCKDGYYYNSKIEKCVRPQDCPSVCGKNEEISTCANGGCDKRNCTQLGQPKLCIDPRICKVGCVCKKGYLRDSKGVCIPIKDCPSCGGDPNARPGCGSHCNRRCSDIGKKPKLCAQQCKVDGCDCKDGYYFDDITGKCVKPENCSCPKPNQVFDLCPLWCPPRTCESLDRAYICPIEYETSPEPCVPGCRCKDGYFSNVNGQCVTEAQCRQCSGPHEYFDCGVECDNVCATLSQQNQTNCPIVNIKCNPKCYCEKGYARAKNNTCIPIPRCKEPQCGVNEKYELCPADRCRPENCSQLGYPLRCPPETSPGSPCPVKPKCVCIDGYVRNNKGVCIPDYECPSCRGDPNAKPGCGLCFTKQCPDHGKGISCAAVCNANGCVCRDNYLYDRIQKKCVRLEDCTPICPTNEVPSNCVNGGCDKRNCSQLGKPDVCIDVKKCYKGCVCKNGYLRNSEGVCVPKDKCPLPCGDNEVYHNCIEGYCDAKTCDDLGFPVACPDVHHERCTKGCLCKDGYVRAANGKCIKKKDCPSCGGDPNAQSGCGVNCGKRCRDIGKKNSVCPLICHVNACDCKPGFYLDENTGKCVLPKKCPPQCPKNEIYNPCVEGDCKPKKCSELGFPISCPRIDPTKCTGACLCVEGYVRADNGTCIPVKKCPSCGGDDNAESGCGVNCGKHCSHIGKEVSCITVCYENACDCKDGYYLNEKTGKCVLPKKCPPSCPKDEVYNSCVEEYCHPKNCSQVGFPIKCPKKGSYRCTGGCLCKEGFVRADNGKCIPIKKCPSCGGDPNAVSGCGVNCNRHCRDIEYEDTAGACIELCKVNSCDCKPGYYYDDNLKKCVLPRDCTPVCDMPHEVFDKCPPKCPPQTCSSIGKKFFCPYMAPNRTDCKPGCRCEKNYYRNLIGECITRQQCLKCPGPHEYFSCGAPCDNECAKLDIQSKCDCPIKNKKCTERCYCEDGYARDENNVCIPIEDCPFPCYDEDIPTTVTPKPAPPSANVTELLEKFRQGNIALTAEYVYQKALSDPGASFVLSALSVLILFSQLLLYSVGLTREQLLRVTNLDSNEEVEKALPALIKLYGEQTNVTFEMANKCYGNKNYPFSDKFKTDAIEIFNSEGENLDFSKNVEAADIINKWVENKTHNQIKDLIKSSALSADTRLVLINALYFFGRWLRPFNVNNTHERDFYVSPDKTISIPFMYQESTFNYGEFDPLNAQVLEMKYGGGNFSSIYWLPKDKFGLLDMLEKMRNPALVSQSMDSLSPEKVKVYVPKMEIESELDVVKLSQKANVTEMFKPGSDGFRGILKIDEPVSVTDAVQKAKIITTEEGTTAAAATGIIAGTTSSANPPPQIKIFDADHPHAFAVIYRGDPVFAGVFYG